MSETSVIDFESFMKTNQDTSFDPKKYINEQRAILQEEWRQNELKKQNQNTQTAPKEKTETPKVVVKEKTEQPQQEIEINYSDFSPPTKIVIKKSSKQGHGVFAKENISEGEVIEDLRLFRTGWRMNYQKDPVIEKYAIADNSCKCRECSIHGPSVYIPMGYGGLYNFGFDSNIKASFDFLNLRMKIIAAEDIDAGEELLFDDSAFNGKIVTAELLK